ncbi:MAG: hypothetical protein ACI9VR_004900 [Cognaticolwellia sp.]|jgi:hypothetical protein
MGTPSEQTEKGKAPRAKRKKLRTRDRIWLAVSKLLGVAHKTNGSGNNMSQR